MMIGIMITLISLKPELPSALTHSITFHKVLKKFAQKKATHYE